MIKTEDILEKLKAAGLTCTVENPIPHGIQFRFSTGVVVNIYHSGEVTVQGKYTHDVEHVLGIRPIS
jgi:ribonuclease HIII